MIIIVPKNLHVVSPQQVARKRVYVSPNNKEPHNIACCGIIY